MLINTFTLDRQGFKAVNISSRQNLSLEIMSTVMYPQKSHLPCSAYFLSSIIICCQGNELRSSNLKLRQNDKLLNIFTTAETHNQVIHAITSMKCCYGQVWLSKYVIRVNTAKFIHLLSYRRISKLPAMLDAVCCHVNLPCLRIF